MKLLVVTQTLDSEDPILGFFCRWVEEFAKKFDTVTVVSLNVGTYSLPKNVTVHTLGKELEMERIPRMLRYVALLIRLRREYTHVFAHMNPEYVIGGGLIWRLLDKKIGFWYVHGTVSLRLRLAAYLAHKIFTASKESCNIESKKIAIVGHGIDVDAFAPAEGRRLDADETQKKQPSIVTVGRLSPSKNLDVFVETIILLKKRGIASTGSIIGNAGTPEDKAYAEHIARAAEEAGIAILSPVPHRDVPDLLRKSDLFLSASTTGSLDKAILEAMSCGVVPVTSNPAFGFLLGHAGLFVERKPEAFAGRLSELLENIHERERLSKIVREDIVKNHSLVRLIDTLKTAYAVL